jgi:hypothetical protein
MDKNDIIEMAQDAGARIESPIRWIMTQEELECFAVLAAEAAAVKPCCGEFQSCQKVCMPRAAAAEREACAKVCENLPWISGHSLPSNVEIAAAIRARGN